MIYGFTPAVLIGDIYGHNYENTKGTVISMSQDTVYFTAENVSGKHDVKKIKRELNAFPGVSSVSVDDGSGRIAVDYDSTGVRSEQLQKKLKGLGYSLSSSDGDGQPKSL